MVNTQILKEGISPLEAAPLEAAIKRIWQEKGVEAYNQLQGCSFGKEYDHLIHSDFLGKLNRACTAENDQNRPNIIYTAKIARKVNDALKKITSLESSVDPDITKSLLALSEEIAYAVENPSSTQEFKQDLFARLKGKDRFDSSRRNACNQLVILAESENVEDQKAASHAIHFVIAFDKANPFSPVFHTEVIFAVLSASERISSDLAPAPREVIELAIRNDKPEVSGLIGAALQSAESISLNSLSEIINKEKKFLGQDLISSIMNYSRKSKAYQKLLESVAYACKNYDQDDLARAASLLSTKPKLSFDLLKSAFEAALSENDPNAPKILEVMRLLPRQNLRLALYLESLLIIRDTGIHKRDIITKSLDSIPKIARGMAKLWGIFKARKEKE